MTRARTTASVAAAYYGDADVSSFYRLCWGGDDIHIGRSETGGETVAEASAAMTRHLLDLAAVGPGDRVLDLACGYGGTLRELAGRRYLPMGIDISTVCVEEARKAVREAGLVDLVAWLHDEFGVSACDRTVSRALKRAGFRVLTARPQACGQDPDAIEAYKKTSRRRWRRSGSATPAASASRSGSRMKRASARRT